MDEHEGWPSNCRQSTAMLWLQIKHTSDYLTSGTSPLLRKRRRSYVASLQCKRTAFPSLDLAQILSTAAHWVFWVLSFTWALMKKGKQRWRVARQNKRMQRYARSVQYGQSQWLSARGLGQVPWKHRHNSMKLYTFYTCWSLLQSTGCRSMNSCRKEILGCDILGWFRFVVSLRIHSHHSHEFAATVIGITGQIENHQDAESSHFRGQQQFEHVVFSTNNCLHWLPTV
jgi:hypothetical protein